MSNFAGVFIEGDRMMTAFYPGVVMMEMLRAVAKGQRIMTGTCEGGVEQLVRMIGEEAGVPVEVIEHTVANPDAETFGASVDWDARHASIPDDVEVLIVHVDHHDARESRSAVAVLPEARVRLWSPVDIAS